MFIKKIEYLIFNNIKKKEKYKKVFWGFTQIQTSMKYWKDCEYWDCEYCECWDCLECEFNEQLNKNPELFDREETKSLLKKIEGFKFFDDTPHYWWGKRDQIIFKIKSLLSPEEGEIIKRWMENREFCQSCPYNVIYGFLKDSREVKILEDSPFYNDFNEIVEDIYSRYRSSLNEY